MLKKNFEFSYLRTKDDAEIDLIVERPGLSTVVIEIKSGTRAHDPDIHKLARFIGDFPGCEAIIISNERMARLVGDVKVLPWREGIARVVGYPAGWE